MIDWRGGGGGANNRVTLTQQTEEIPIESESERERDIWGEGPNFTVNISAGGMGLNLRESCTRIVRKLKRFLEGIVVGKVVLVRGNIVEGYYCY